MELNNIKPSITRVKILDYLVNRANHPSVEEISSALASEIPTLSKTTVYNALDLFVEAGLARVINVGDNESRYDINPSDHGHFKCDSCGKVYDFWISFDDLQVQVLENFKVKEKNIYYRGYCPECMSNK